MIEYPNPYNKIILVCYPADAGGNFLINNMSLSDQSIFRSAQLARHQLDNKFNYQQKLQYLFDQLDFNVAVKIWNDLGLGCQQLFGFDSQQYLSEYHPVLAQKFNRIVNLIIKNNLTLFAVSHNTKFLKSFMEFWPNSRIIFLTNSRPFIRQRNLKTMQFLESRRIQHWQDIKKETWPLHPPKTLKEFDLLPIDIRKELDETYDIDASTWINFKDNWFEIYNNEVDKLLINLGDRAYNFDVEDLYSDETKFATGLIDCLKWTQLPPPLNIIDNKKYFKTWKQVINSIHSTN